MAARPVLAQCPDGTPPPCPGRRAALSPDRIAILPFRVAAADTLLGQGMAELVAPEFNGENGPLAVNMPTVLRVWRHAGGGLRTPLAPQQVRSVAREIGAGRVVDGSVVGLGGTITVTATVTDAASGTERRVGPLSGPTDSLLSLVGRLTSALLGATGAAPVNFQMHLTDSPAAMRAYLEGIARFRVGAFELAAPAFARAFALDTLFARAALMRMVTGSWGQGIAGWDTTTWNVRDRLSSQDRILLTALLGDHFPAWRSPERNLADRRRAAALLPQSPEAQFELGDYLYHYGSATGIDDDFASARAQLELAYRMDPQFEEVIHLLEIALYTGDSALSRSMWMAFQGMPRSPHTSAFGRVLARVLRDSAAGRYDSIETYPWWVMNAATVALLPADEVAQVFGRSPEAPAGVRARSSERSWRLCRRCLVLPGVAVNSGRVAWLPDSSDVSAKWKIIGATLALSGDSAIAEPLIHATDAVAWDTAGHPIRAAAVGLFQALRSHAGDLRVRTMRLDSMVRWDIANHGFATEEYEGLLLGDAWQELGETGRALAAVRLDEWQLHIGVLLAPRLRQEGRLQAIVGDTARAIRAYQRYLKLRRDADPVLIPERDSVRAALARLERR